MPALRLLPVKAHLQFLSLPAAVNDGAHPGARMFWAANPLSIRLQKWLVVVRHTVCVNCVRLLFIKLKHIGDSLLLTPTLMAARVAYPASEISVVVRRGTEGILSGCPAVDHLHTAAPAEAGQRSAGAWLSDLRLAFRCGRQRFDYAFELSDGDRGRWLASLSGARIRTTNIAKAPLHWWWQQRFNSFSQFRWHEAHAVEKDYYTVHDALPLPATVPPLAFVRERTREWAPAGGGQDFAVLHPGTRWLRKRWPLERWLVVAQELASVFPRLIISAGPDPDEVRDAAELEHALSGRAISTAGQLKWAQLAGLLYRARLFVGVDTAAMHLAAACQVPVVGLFGPSDARVWRPWHVAHELVSPPGDQPHLRTMNDITVPQVLAACRRMVHLNALSGGLSPERA